MPHSEDSVTLARGAGVAFVLQVSGAGLAFGLQVLLARWMGAGNFGAYTYTIGWSGLLAVICGLGLSTMVVRFIPAYAHKEDSARLQGLLRTSLLFTFVASASVSILGTALILWLNARGATVSRNALIGLWMVPLFALMTLQQEITRAFRRIGLAYAPSLVLRPMLVIAGGLVYISFGHHLESTAALSITFASLFLAITLQAFSFWRRLGAPVRQAKPAYELRGWLTTAFPLMLIASFVVVLMQTDIVMVGAILGHRAAGLYGAAAKTAGLVGLVLLAVNSISAPVFASLFAQNRHEDLQQLASDIAEWIFWPSLLISVFLAIFSKPVLSLFGSEFSTAHWQLTILLVGQVVSAGAGSVGWLMLLTGHQNKAAWVYGWVALIHVVLLAFAIPLLGTIGAALATTVSLSLWNIWLHKLVVLKLGIRPSIFAALHKARND
jgi:Membrane protein involved in the export of O-antigen and teichoic acid